MTIGAPPSRVSFNCDGSSKVFPVPLQAYLNTDLTVTLTAPASSGGGETTLTLNSDYSLASSGTLQPTAWTLTTLAAYATGYTLQVFVNPVQQQQTQYAQGQAFPSLAVQANLDRLTQMAQRLQDQVSRALHTPDGDVNPLMTLPTAANRALMALMFDAFGNAAIGVPNTQTITTALLAPFLNLGQTGAEVTSGVTPSVGYFPFGYDVRRCGVVPNNSGAASANTTAIRALLNPAVAGITGRLIFPNTTGVDVYYFNDIIPIRDGVKLDGMGCTLNFTKTGVSADTNCGFLHAIRDVTIENMTIVVAYTYVAGSNTGNAIAFGNRSNDATSPPLPANWSPLFDSLLASRMGNLVVRNVRVSTNAGAQGNGVLMIGGFDGVTFENFFLDGQGTLNCAINYEFGWATNEALAQNRQTSHARNLAFRNVRLTNLDPAAGIGLNLAGAYNAVVDGLFCNSMSNAVTITCGESLFYRPWAGNDGTGVKRGIHLRAIVASTITQIGLNLIGAQLATGYLNPLGLTAVSETDLLDVEVDGFALTGTSNNHGVSSSAGRVILRNGQITGFQHGINTTQECTEFLIEAVRVFNSTDVGIFIGQTVTIYSPARFSSGIIRKCFVAGSVGAAIAAATTVNLLIQANRFGYELIHDSIAETTQTFAVNAGVDATGVICDSNYVAAAVGGTAYNLASGSSSNRGCTITNAQGVLTTAGIWKSVIAGMSQDRGDTSPTLSALADFKLQMFQTTLTANRTITVNTAGAVAGDRFRIVRTGLGAFTLAVGALKTIPSATAAFVDIEYDAVAGGWRLTGYGTL